MRKTPSENGTLYECNRWISKMLELNRIKVRLVKGMVIPVVTYACESWTVKKAECQRIDAFEL